MISYEELVDKCYNVTSRATISDVELVIAEVMQALMDQALLDSLVLKQLLESSHALREKTP